MVTFAACGSKEEVCGIDYASDLCILTAQKLSLWAIDFGGWVAGIHLMVELRW